METKIPGEFNVCNASLAASVAVMLKIDTESIRDGVLSTKVPGRMEKYKNNIVVVTKEEVSKHLPKLSVNQQYCEMTSEQAEMMARILDELKEAKDQEFLLSQKSNDQKDFEDNPEYVSIKARIMMLQTIAPVRVNSVCFVAYPVTIIATEN